MKERRFVLALLLGTVCLRAAAPSVMDSGASSASTEIAARGPLQLTLRKAVQIATSPEGNTRVQLQAEDLKQAKDRSREVLSYLLPDIEADVRTGSQIYNLSSTGLTNLQELNSLDGLLEKFGVGAIDIPSRIGPFETLDLRATVQGPLFDFSIWTKLRASHASVRASKNDVHTTDENVTSQVSKAYLTALRADTDVQLVDKLTYKPLDTLSVEDAIAQALANRPDLKSQLEQETAARLNAKGVKYERLPSVVAQANYGTIGNPSVSLLPTREFFGEVRVPIFDGGRRDARRAEAFSQAREAGIKAQDLRDQIELDVRESMDSLKSADEQVQVAEEGLKQAEREMAQARRRFDAGVAGSLEVSDASDKLQRARTNEIDAVYNHSVARIDLGHALGKTQSMID
jgi:outer membrane protein TolC